MWRIARKDIAGLGKAEAGRALHSRRREPDAEADSGQTGGDYGIAVAEGEAAVRVCAYATGVVDTLVTGKIMGREPRVTLDSVRMGRKKMFVSSAPRRSATWAGSRGRWMRRCGGRWSGFGRMAMPTSGDRDRSGERNCAAMRRDRPAGSRMEAEDVDGGSSSSNWDAAVVAICGGIGKSSGATSDRGGDSASCQPERWSQSGFAGAWISPRLKAGMVGEPREVVERRERVCAPGRRRRMEVVSNGWMSSPGRSAIGPEVWR